mgnify:CR=1 FL=1
MSSLSLPLRLTGARILGDAGLEERPLTIAAGRITSGAAPEIDLAGFDVLPGVVDLLARAPESGGLPDLAARGITTAWLAQDWSWQGPHHSPDAAEAMLTRLAARQDGHTDLRPLLVCDTHMMDHEARLVALLHRFQVSAVLLVDRLSHFALPSDPALRGIAESLLTRSAEVPRHLCNLAHVFDALGVRSGSYGDRDGQARERLAMIGAKICAAPAGAGAAAVARAWGDPVLMPAHGVTRPQALPGQPDVTAMIGGGMCDALVSDGRPESLVTAARGLATSGQLPLPGAWSLISQRPARIMGLTDRGRLVPGLRADLCVLHRGSGRIAATMAAGHWTWRSRDFASRLHAPSAGLAGQGIATSLRANPASSLPRSS